MSINFNLINFEGPLDLLFALVKEKKMDLLALDVRELATQYLAIVSGFKNKDIDEIAEYLVMASDLIEMKSHFIIPIQAENADPNLLIDSERDKLVNRLIAYKKYKDIVLQMQRFEERRKLVFSRITNEGELFFEGIVEENLPDFVNPDEIMDVISTFSDRSEINDDTPRTIVVKELSAEDIENKIMRYSEQNERFTLTQYLSSIDELQLSMQYLALTFLALLNLARRQNLKISQEQMFNEIKIVYVNESERNFL